MAQKKKAASHHYEPGESGRGQGARAWHFSLRVTNFVSGDKHVAHRHRHPSSCEWALRTCLLRPKVKRLFVIFHWAQFAQINTIEENGMERNEIAGTLVHLT